MIRRRNQNRRAAFTLLEVLLVLLIIGLLVGMVAPYMFGVQDRAKIDTARGQIGLIQSACDLFRLHMNDYPASLQQLIENPQTGSKWAGPYMEKLPKDPWNNDYVYEPVTGAKPRIYSMGPDGQAGSADDVFQEEAETQQ
jgi:general secretion pathway protein G